MDYKLIRMDRLTGAGGGGGRRGRWGWRKGVRDKGVEEGAEAERWGQISAGCPVPCCAPCCLSESWKRQQQHLRSLLLFTQIPRVPSPWRSSPCSVQMMLRQARLLTHTRARTSAALLASHTRLSHRPKPGYFCGKTEHRPSWAPCVKRPPLQSSAD